MMGFDNPSLILEHPKWLVVKASYTFDNLHSTQGKTPTYLSGFSHIQNTGIIGPVTDRQSQTICTILDTELIDLTQQGNRICFVTIEIPAVVVFNPKPTANSLWVIGWNTLDNSWKEES